MCGGALTQRRGCTWSVEVTLRCWESCRWDRTMYMREKLPAVRGVISNNTTHTAHTVL